MDVNLSEQATRERWEKSEARTARDFGHGATEKKEAFGDDNAFGALLCRRVRSVDPKTGKMLGRGDND